MTEKTAVWSTSSEEQTRELGRKLALGLECDAVLLLVGPMGSGKTVFTQGVGSGLGIDPAEVQSPSFTIVREHGGSRPLYHIDLYRLDPEEVLGLGLEELLAGPGVKVIEWAERLPWDVSEARWYRFRRLDDGRHEICELRVGDGAEQSGTAWR